MPFADWSASSLYDPKIILAALVAAGWAVWKLASRPIEKAIDAKLSPDLALTLWHRIVALILIVHACVALGAVIWCFVATTLPPPNMPKDMRNPLLSAGAQRFFEYDLALCGIGFGLLPLYFRATARRVASLDPMTLTSLMRASPSIYLFGLLGGSIWVLYDANFQPSQLSYAALPAFNFDMAVWYYACLPFCAFGVSATLGLMLAALSWLWAQVSVFEA